MHNNTLLTALVIVVVFVGGFMIGRMTSQSPLPTFMTTSTNETKTSDTADSNTSVTNNTQTSGNSDAASTLSEGQLKMLASFGIDPNSITPAMIACGEAKLGAERTAEIKGGATPSISEGISLMACYK